MAEGLANGALTKTGKRYFTKYYKIFLPQLPDFAKSSYLIYYKREM